MNSPCKQVTSVSTTCPYCGVGCGVTATVTSNTIDIDGDKNHPANFGKLCSKGYALADTLGTEGRLLEPSINGVESTWDQAVERIAQEFETAIHEYGPDSIAFYVSGQLLSEDYYVANKFVKGYLGTASIDTNSRLCMASSVAAHKRAFGSDTVPGCYEDLEQADVVVLVGSNLAWCHPVLFQRIQKAKENNPKMRTVVLDPRVTATAELCDVHVQLKAGGESDAVLYLGLLRYLNEHKCLNSDWIEQYTTDFDEALSRADNWTVSKVSAFTGLLESEVLAFYQLYQHNKKIVTVYSQGVNQSHKGTDTVNAIINAHLATGKIGTPGCGPFSITGQPNAMGGREVGGLANMLACHMDLENEKHQSLVQRFWGSPHIVNKQGLKAIDLFSVVQAGKIKALWVMATNPVDSMPNANAIKNAIAECPFVVVSDVTAQTDTAVVADVLLPARAWSEKDGTVTNSERRISRQRSFRTAPSGTRPDWWAVAKVAQQMGYTNAFNYSCASEIFAEHAELSGYENAGSRSFDISAYKSITDNAYNNMEPFQWPQAEFSTQPKTRFFAKGEFYTHDKKAKFIPVELSNPAIDESAVAVNEKHPALTLNTGRIRDQWHTMTRTGTSARLSSHLGEPFVEINPIDARSLEIHDAEIVDVSSTHGTTQLRALITSRVAPKEVFVPMHWTNQFAANARVNSLVHTKHDPVSGQPASKNQLISLSVSKMQTYGFMISRVKPNTHKHDYWAIARAENGWKTEFASTDLPLPVMNKMLQHAEQMLPDSELVRFDDANHSRYRACWFSESNRLEAAVFLAAEPVQLHRHSVFSLFNHTFEKCTDRLSVVSGAGLPNTEDVGTIICSCMQVGAKTIQRAILEGSASIESVGVRCGAGTQCGTCRSDIRRMLA